MATPSQAQPYPGGNPYPAPPSQGTQGPPPQSAGGFGGPESRPSQSAQGHYGVPSQPPQFDKYCIIHIATTCDEHGVYVTKDSAEVIEIGWTVVDARDPNLGEVCLILSEGARDGSTFLHAKLLKL